MKVVVLTGLPPCALHGDCTADTEDRVAAGLDNGVVRHSLPSFIVHLLAIEVSGVIVVASNVYYPVVGLRQAFPAFVVHIFEVTRTEETEAAVPRDHNQGVGQLLGDTGFEYQLAVITVNVPADYNPFGTGKLAYVYAVHSGCMMFAFSVCAA